MAGILATSRLEARGRRVVPKAVREALGVDPGDSIGYAIRDGRVTLGRVSAKDPFAEFEEWASSVDTEGYASL